jgi:hypothetical protein
MTTQNLIEIQSSLQNPVNVTMQDLIKYANGSNPEVPSYLALMEMSRRKNIEQTSQAFNQPQSQGTVKDQTVNAIMNRQQVNPAAAPSRVNPAGSPQMVDPTRMARQAMPGQAAPQVDPTQAPPMQAAEGGLMSIPVKHFKTQSFAGGGIVAFDEGGETRYDPETATRRKDYQTEEPLPTRQMYKLGKQDIEGPRSIEEIQRGLPSITPMQGNRPSEMTPEQAYQRNKEIQKLAGVAEDPFADVRKRQEKIEARQEEEYKNNAMNRLLAQAEAFATAEPSMGFGYAAAASSKASRSLEKDQQEIRNKQEALNLDIARNMAKEEDARRRGDAAGVKEALKEIKSDQREYDRLQMERDKMEQAQIGTATNIRNSDISANKLPLDIYSAETQQQNANTQELQARNAAEHQRFLRTQAELNKEKPASKEFSRLNDDFEQSIFVKSLKAKLEAEEVGSDEYNNLIRTYNKAREQYFKPFMEKNPDMGLPSLPMTDPTPVKEKPGFFDRLFSSSEPKPRTLSFDQLPK